MGIEPTPSAWKAEVLPLNYTRTCFSWRGQDSNLRRLSRQIYSLIPLTAREPLQKHYACKPRIFHHLESHVKQLCYKMRYLLQISDGEHCSGVL